MQVGIIGYGRWGPNHARVFSELATLVAIADRDRGSLDRAGEKYPSVLRYTDYRDAINAVDAVVVATPVSSHAEIVAHALMQGKHVLWE
ncbi:MAG TPA: Gfo/Idh/MocA family oxidoreductase, partial [Anaerolineae bacterium]|nr:Gfo/Idh/MocA family oxidoreductase [Anaerolineae bacterium]